MTVGLRLILTILAGGVLMLIFLNFNIFENFSSGPSEITASLHETGKAAVSPSENQTRLLSAADKEFLIYTGDEQYLIKPAKIKSWLDRYYRSYTGRQEFRPNLGKIEGELNNLAKKFDRRPVDSRFRPDTEGRISELSPAQAGLKINTLLSAANIAGALMRGQNSAGLAYDLIEPRINPARVSELGIKTLLAAGKSNFEGSPPARANNIKLGTGVFDGILLKPGEEFSFNQRLGPVEASQGYQYELVVKNKKLVPEYGGGLCQVSTTIFRAAAAAGLPIIERHPHSLPVRYYKPQGFDATIYPGISDLRFKNDTPTSILIQGETIGSTLSFEIYGSDDGRKVSIDGPHIYDAQPDGSLKTWLKRVVVSADGIPDKDIFYSSYQSPSLFPKIRNPLE